MNPLWLANKLEICSAAITINRVNVSPHVRLSGYPERRGEIFNGFGIEPASHRFSGKSVVRLLRLALFFSLSLGFASITYSQTLTRADSAIKSIKSLFDNGSYISAELEARRMLEDRTVNDSTRVQLEKYLAFSLVAEGRNQPAIEHFLKALMIDSSMTLDPVMTSPKILQVFNAAKEEFRSNRKEETSAPEKKAIPRNPNNLAGSGGTTFRAILFPGWEQVYAGRETKGYILLGAGAVTAVSSIAFDFLRRDARTKYLDASTPDLAASTYKTYNAYYKTEFYSISAFVLIYVYSELDSFLKLPPHFSMNYSPEKMSASLDFRMNF